MSTTREKLLDSAARLFAERGVFNVPLAEVVRDAGQKNVSAIRYHFGERDHLLVALLQPNIDFVRRRRLDLLEDVAASGAESPRPIARALIQPIIELAGLGWRERAVLHVGTELSRHPGRCSSSITALLGETASGRAELMLARCYPDVPPTVWEFRVRLCFALVELAAASRASALDEGADAPPAEAFVAELVEMYLGALSAPQASAAGRASTARPGRRPARAQPST